MIFATLFPKSNEVLGKNYINLTHNEHHTDILKSITIVLHVCHDLRDMSCPTFRVHFLDDHPLPCFLFPFLGVGLFFCLTGLLLCSFWCTRFWTRCYLSWLFIGGWLTFDLWGLVFIGCLCFLFVWAGTARAFSWTRF